MASRDIFVLKTVVLDKNESAWQKDGQSEWLAVGNDCYLNFEDIPQPIKVIWTPGDEL